MHGTTGFPGKRQQSVNMTREHIVVVCTRNSAVLRFLRRSAPFSDNQHSRLAGHNEE